MIRSLRGIHSPAAVGHGRDFFCNLTVGSKAGRIQFRCLSESYRVIQVNKRDKDGSNASRRMRYEGNIPGVLYGKAFPRHVLLTTQRAEIEREIRVRQASFENTLYKIIFEEDNSEHLVVPRTLQMHRYNNYPISCNFLGYDPEIGMKMTIPLFWMDEEKSNGLKRGGVLNRVYWEVKCRVKGMDIPTSLGVSLAGKNIGSRIRWSEIKVPQGIELIKPHNNPEEDPVIATLMGKRSLMEPDEPQE